MKLEDLVQGESYSFELHEQMYVGTYQEHFDVDGVTRKAYVNKFTNKPHVEIQCPNPKGGLMAYSIPLDAVKAV